MRNAMVVPVLIVLVIAAAILTRTFRTVPAGHVAVATLFGKVRPASYPAGLHFPVNPLYQWTVYDARQKTHMEQAAVPSQDQLQTQVDVSVQYRIDKTMASVILAETGTAEDTVRVHLIPKLRSLLREQGKSIKRAEDFFMEETQQTLQLSLTEGLRDYLEPKGIFVDNVLIRDINLPAFITRAIEQKKEREQAAEKQKAELERFRTEQQQRVAQATAEREAAEQLAAQQRVLADAQAYEIEKVNTAVGNNPAYIKLQALEALKSIAGDPASKIYFLSGDSPMPLPLMHMGETP